MMPMLETEVRAIETQKGFLVGVGFLLPDHGIPIGFVMKYPGYRA